MIHKDQLIKTDSFDVAQPAKNDINKVLQEDEK